MNDYQDSIKASKGKLIMNNQKFDIKKVTQEAIDLIKSNAKIKKTRIDLVF